MGEKNTCCFVDSLFSQTLIIHVIRTNKIPFLQSRARKPLSLASLVMVAVGAWLPYSLRADALGLTPRPPLYWVLLTKVVKSWFYHRFGE